MQSDDLAYFDSEEFRTILNQYEESVESEHPVYIDADDLADIADYYQYNGFPEKARAAVNLALEYNPEAVGPLLFKAREAIMANDFDTAEEYAEKIEAVDTAEAIYLKGEIMISQGKTEEADQYFIDQMKEVMQDELMDYVYDVANIFSDYNLHDKAFQWMARSQGDDSDSFKELMAHTLFGLGKYKDSERIFNELIDHDPYSIRYWNALASAQFMREDYSAAITSSEYAIAIDPKDPDTRKPSTISSDTPNKQTRTSSVTCTKEPASSILDGIKRLSVFLKRHWTLPHPTRSTFQRSIRSWPSAIVNWERQKTLCIIWTRHSHWIATMPTWKS